ncbi:unnamed protein product [Rotaria sordida]|uniref:Uncharacterized protein n=1 Tax=Rotaria sordida TaxID=392033 RepID=A0A813TMC2_9BILA|nr:unnamed protein product [Rotaria sordida]CAF0820933.1 unnamed protein product [Rotaria sordida]
MISNRFRLLSLINKTLSYSKRWTITATVNNTSEIRINKKPIKKSMYSYKRLQTTYYHWMEAVNRVDVRQSEFHRPLIIRSTVRQILRFMHDGYINIEQWGTFRDYLVKKDIGVSRLFDGIFLHECINYQRFLMGLSYINYLKYENIPLTPTSLAMLLLLAREIDIRYELYEYCLDEKILLDTYQEFLSYKILPDSMLALPIIAGLTLTKQWKESLKYLPILDNDLDGMQQALGFVLTAAAKFHDYIFFFSLLDNISQTELIRLYEQRQRIRSNDTNTIFNIKQKLTLDQQVKRPIAPSRIKESDYYLIAKTSQAYETFTNYLTGEKTKQIETLIKLLEKTASNGYIPPISFVKSLEKKLKELDPTKYKCDYIYFYPNGISLDGKTTLSSIEPTEDECQILHTYIRNNFQSLLELHCSKLAEDPSKLLKYLSEPFDVLFDCLHYPTLELDWRIRHPLYIKRVLYQIADEKGKRCLVIAKIDLADYIDSLQMPTDLVSVVRVPYESIKSPLSLLSTLFHSPTTLLASPIDQRFYKSLLGLNNIDIFDRWIQTHQLVPITKPDLVYLQAPCLYSTRVHVNTSEWLIPYFDGSPLTDAENVQTWFRVQINNY